jgi:hypothetical protein
MMTDKLCDVDCTLVHETDLAWLVESDDTGKRAWVPKSMCEFAKTRETDSPPCEGVLTMSSWFATEKELV